MKPYPIQLEISGPTALWTRPDTLPNPVSYAAPTFSAAKGLFEAVVRWKSVNVCPTRCEICAPVQFHSYAFNYGGPLRDTGAMKKNAAKQIFAQVLINVRYRLYAQADWNRGPNGEPADSPDGTCSPHAYADVFNRRLERGRWFHTPCLGWKEFVPDYFGLFRDGTRPCESEHHEIPAMLWTVFDRPQQGQRGRETYYPQQVRNGVLEYREGRANHAQ
jgi:CRISPR-associated protein Cas5d